MEAAFITPFVGAVQNVFSTMLSTLVTVGTPCSKSGDEPCADVSAIIGMSGDVTGAVCLSFPFDTAERLISIFVGAGVDANSDDFVDAVGELANMIAGNAKAEFPTKQVSISCPSVVIGQDHYLAQQKDSVTISIPCECECGTFVVDVTLKEGETVENSSDQHTEGVSVTN